MVGFGSMAELVRDDVVDTFGWGLYEAPIQKEATGGRHRTPAALELAHHDPGGAVLLRAREAREVGF